MTVPLPDAKPIHITHYAYIFGAMVVVRLSYMTRADVAEFGESLAKVGGLYVAEADTWIPYHQIISIDRARDGK